jgi:uncharacterized protein with HEPN domain
MLNDQVYILHIRDCILHVLVYTKGGKSEFMSSSLIQDAVVRNVEVIGEAVKKLSPELKLAHPEIPWRRIARMRDKAIHHYFGMDWDLVWEVVEVHIPQLQTTVECILRELDEHRPQSSG